jgi:polyisoprenoid-binding protein YceI
METENMKKIPVIVATVTALLTSALAAPHASAQDVSQNALTVTAGTYQVEPRHTQVGFSVLHFGFTYYSGVFSHVSGMLKLDTAHPAASKLDVTIPINSVQTTSAELDGKLKGAQWFDAAKDPTATFVSTKVIPTGANTARVEGKLTIHGVTEPETLSVKLIGAGINPADNTYTVGFEAIGMIKRSQFGVNRYVPLVGDDVSLRIAGAFVLHH